MRKTRLLVLALGLLVAAHAGAAEQQAAVPVEQQKVSRLPPLPQPLDPALQAMFEKRRSMGGDIINLQIATGHAPKLSQAAETMAFALRFDAVTPRKLRELAILRTAEIVGSDYEINQHRPLLKACGYSDPQIDGVAHWRQSSLFDEKQRALLAYVEAMTEKRGNVDDATFATVQKFFSPQEIVELTYTISNYYGNGLLTKALRIEVERDGRLTVAGKC
jgi:alkylhydroperoxidase family enzyme